MPSLKPVLRFVAVFALIYGVLLAPWPRWRATYAAGFRWLGQTCWGASSPLVVNFRATPDAGPLDTQIVVYNPAQTNAHGRVQAKLLGLDTRGVGWIPTAFLGALILASPVPWSRRLRALVFGWAALYVYLLLAIRAYIWNETMANAASVSKSIAAGLEETLITQLGPSFVVPAILWLLMTFRQTDLEATAGWIARTSGRVIAKP